MKLTDGVVRTTRRVGQGGAKSRSQHPRHKETSRSRVFTPAELRLIWNNLGDDAYGAILKLLALTG
jgi:hypothetical protein